MRVLSEHSEALWFLLRTGLGQMGSNDETPRSAMFSTIIEGVANENYL